MVACGTAHGRAPEARGCTEKLCARTRSDWTATVDDVMFFTCFCDLDFGCKKDFTLRPVDRDICYLQLSRPDRWYLDMDADAKKEGDHATRK